MYPKCIQVKTQHWRKNTQADFSTSWETDFSYICAIFLKQQLCAAPDSCGIHAGRSLAGSGSSFFQILHAHGMFQLPGPIKRGFSIWIKSCNLKACPRGLAHPCHCEQENKRCLLRSRTRASQWRSPHRSVQCFSNAAMGKKRKEKIFLYSLQSALIWNQNAEERLFSHAPAPAETHINLRGTPGVREDLGNRLNPRGLAKYHTSPWYQLHWRNWGRWHIKKGQ